MMTGPNSCRGCKFAGRGAFFELYCGVSGLTAENTRCRLDYVKNGHCRHRRQRRILGMRTDEPLLYAVLIVLLGGAFVWVIS